MRREERIAVALFALVTAAITSWLAFDEFIRREVSPDIAAVCAVIIFIAVLGAFGVITVKAKL